MPGFPQVIQTAITNGTNATTDAEVDLPTGIAAGDLLFILHRSAIGLVAHDVNGGGWTKRLGSTADGSDDGTSIFIRQADGSEVSPVTILQSNSKFASLAWRIVGADVLSIENPGFSGATTGNSTSPDPSNLTPFGGALDYLWIWMGGWEGEQTSPPSGTPSGYSNPIGASSGTAGVVTTNCRVAAAFKNANASSEDGGIWTISASDDWTAIVASVRPNNIPPPLRAIQKAVITRSFSW